MRRYADPDRCPGCGSPLTPGSTSCGACHLDLGGTLGLELFTTLTRADELLAAMRQRSATPAPATAAVAAAPHPTAHPGQVRPVRPHAVPPQPPAPLVRGSSVPKILLALGAVCVLVAALVFLAVTWSVMGVGGRTATLVGFTLATGLLTAWVAGRGLRGAVEALGLVTLGLVVLDLYGAGTAGWLGNPSDAGMTTIVGAVLVAAGLGAVRALSRTEAAGFTSGELAAVLGALLVSAGLAAQDWGVTAARLLLALCLVVLLTAVVWSLVRTGSNVFRVAAWALVPVVLLAWVALVVVGLDALGVEPTLASVWGRLEAWPLVAAAGVALLVAVPGRLPALVRVGSAALGVVALSLAVVAPAADEETTVAIVAAVAVAAAVVVLMTVAPRPWGASGLAAGALSALVLAIESLTLLGAAVERYVAAAELGWTGTTAGRLPAGSPLGGDRPWLLPLCVAALVALGWSAARLTEQGRAAPGRLWLGTAGVAVGGALVLMMLLYPVPVWTVLAALLAAGAAAGLLTLARDSLLAAVVGAGALAAAVVLSWYDDELTAVTVAVTLVLVGVVHLRSRSGVVAGPAGGAVAALLAGLVWTLGMLLEVDGSWTGLVGLVLLSALLLGRHHLAVGLRTPRVDAVLELAVLGAAFGLVSAALDATTEAHWSTWLAVYLTVSGATATILAIVRADRRPVAWFGGLLLAAATWVRLEDIGVDEPEPYTLPTAVALLVVGLVRLRRDPSAGTQRTLGAGLVLALVPSLLWVGSYPGGLRSLLLGLACLGLVVGGAQLRWLAPLVHGAGVGLVVVLVEAGPHIGDAVPRWGLIGAAGALLIVLGVTWEQRLREARSVAAYVHGLR